jgi:hypothetical protein
MMQMWNHFIVTNILHDDRTISLRNHYLYPKNFSCSPTVPPPPQTYTTPQLAAVSPPPNGGGGGAGWDSSEKLKKTVYRGK